MNNVLRESYYYIKPLVPKKLLFYFRRQYIRIKIKCCKDVWPIDEQAGHAPDGWKGWPDGKNFALVLTHDIERADGQEKCYQLAELEMSYGFRSSFNFVGKDYVHNKDLIHFLRKNDFEIGLHGLTHKGNLFKSRKKFTENIPLIKKHLEELVAVGFRTPSMYHNLEWIHELGIEYDSSTFDTDPFEPQPDGLHTIFPIWVNNNSCKGGYVELPYTLPQDFTLFILMKQKDNMIWRKKLHWIVEKGGMMLLNTHPDYINFNQAKTKIDEYPADYYKDFLIYIRENYRNSYWHTLPREISRFWSNNYSSVI